MKTWSDFYPFVLPSAIGCPKPTADFFLKQAAIEFFTSSRAWIDPLPAVSTVVGQASYSFGASAEQQVIGIDECRIDGGDALDVGHDEEVDGDTSTGTPSRIWTDDLLAYSLWRVPSVADQQVVNKVVLAPSQSATGVDDRLFALYANAIAHAALAQLLALPDKPWTNPQLALYFAGMGGAATNFAATQARTGGARLRVRRAAL